MSLRPLLSIAAAVAAFCSLPASAQDAYFVEAGAASRGTWQVTGGIRWNGKWRRDWLASEASGAIDLQLSHWSWRRAGGGRGESNVLGVVPLLRLQFDHGRSPWFFEGGIGLTLADRRYHTPDKDFSTAFNFHDVLALGRSVGAGEVSLRLVHTSNGGVKHPNPGENFLQVRWGTKF